MSLFRYTVPVRHLSRYARPLRRDYFPLTAMLNDVQRMMRAFDDDFFFGDRYVRRQSQAEEQPEHQREQQAQSATSEASRNNAQPENAPATQETKSTSQVAKTRRAEQSLRAWDPFDFDFGTPSLFRRFDDLMPAWANREFQTFTPRFDVVEEEKQYRVAMEVPGVRKEDLKIRLGEDAYGNRTLTISGERRSVWSDDAEPEAQAVQQETTADETKTAEAKTESNTTGTAAENGKQSRVRRVSYGSFSRTIALPDDVDVQGISAKQDNGILRLVLPRVARPEPKEQEINIQ